MEPTQNNPVNAPIPSGTSIPPAPIQSNAPTPAAPPQPSPTPELFAPDPAPFNNTVKSGKKKFIIIGIIVAVSILILGALYFFLIFWPNQPQNVWKTGINRSGQAVDKLVNNATEAQTLDSFKKSKINVTLDADAAGTKYSGTLDTKFDESKADGSLNITAEGAANANVALSAKFLSEFKESSQFPSVYFQVTGLKSLGLGVYAPGITAFDGKWISVDETYWSKLGITAEQLNKTKEREVTSEDIATTARAMTTTINDYVFTTDPSKAIFEQRKFIGKEKVDDLNTYHYQVGINKNNAKSFCDAVINTAMDTPIYKKFANDESNKEQYKSDAIKSCQESVDKDLEDTNTFDLWIDAKYKLIYKVRIPEADKQDVYVDIGQNYKGDNQVSLFVNYHDGQEKSDAKFNVTTDIESHKTTGSLTANGGEGQDAYSVKLVITAEPYDGEIDVTKPEGAIPIEQLLNELGYSNKP